MIFGCHELYVNMQINKCLYIFDNIIKALLNSIKIRNELSKYIKIRLHIKK